MMDYKKAIEILRILSKKGYSILDLCDAIEQAAKYGAFPEIQTKEKTLDEKIEDCLRDFYIPRYLKGWKYLKLIVKLKIQDEKDKLNATELYGEVAKQFNTSYKAVERAIRVEMNKALKGGISEEIMIKYFNDTPKVTTKQFFMEIVRMVKDRR